MGFFSFLALVALQAAPVGASPPVTDPTTRPSGWEPRDCLKLERDRSILQIIWACLATIIACTWVAVHPNLSSPRDSELQHLKRRVITMIMAIIAPELMVTWAVRQRIAAASLKKTYNDEFYGGVDPELSMFSKIKQWFTGSEKNRKKGWTLTHGFFVQMGGFMAYHDAKPIRVLTYRCLLDSITLGEIDISSVREEDITEKSRGDFLTKLIVAAQTTWFTVQCAARWRSGLPLAELEVLTLVFAAFNSILYFIWWNKPQGVMTPIKLQLRSPSSASSTKDPISPHAVACTRPSKLSIYHSDSTTSTIWSDLTVSSFRIDGSSTHSNHRSTLTATPFYAVATILSSLWMLPDNVSLDAGDGKSAATTGPTRVPIFYAEGLHENSDIILAAVLPSLAISSILGVIHLIPWPVSFPDFRLQWLWRASAVSIIAAQLIPLLSRRMGFRLFAAHASGLSVLVYITARCISIYFSFSMLSSLPDGVFRDIAWLDVLPHVG